MTEDEFYALADEDCPWQFLGGELVREPVSERHEDIFAYARTIRVDLLEPGGYRTRSHAAGALASAVVPGFWIEVAWLWQDPLPAPLSCLRRILA
jgi:hypothetical protein